MTDLNVVQFRPHVDQAILDVLRQFAEQANAGKIFLMLGALTHIANRVGSDAAKLPAEIGA